MDAKNLFLYRRKTWKNGSALRKDKRFGLFWSKKQVPAVLIGWMELSLRTCSGCYCPELSCWQYCTARCRVQVLVHPGRRWEAQEGALRWTYISLQTEKSRISACVRLLRRDGHTESHHTCQFVKRWLPIFCQSKRMPVPWEKNCVLKSNSFSSFLRTRHTRTGSAESLLLRYLHLRATLFGLNDAVQYRKLTPASRSPWDRNIRDGQQNHWKISCLHGSFVPLLTQNCFPWLSIILWLFQIIWSSPWLS